MAHSSFRKKKHRWSRGQDTLSEDYNKFVEIPPFMVNAAPCILLANEDAPYLRCDHNQGTYVKRKTIIIPVDANLYCFRIIIYHFINIL
jgi:hypothetical protein